MRWKYLSNRIIGHIEDKSPTIVKIIDWILLFSIIVIFLVMLYDFGFIEKGVEFQLFSEIYRVYISIYLTLGAIRIFFNFFYNDKLLRQKKIEFLIWILFFIAMIAYDQKWDIIATEELSSYITYFIYPLFLLTFFYSISKNAVNFYNRNLNPAFLLAFTFFVLSGVGTLCLMLPNATFNGISFIDALFTSVSAVCITGLVVVDTAETFTFMGQCLLLIMMQLGGLGVMTFAGLLGKMFASGVSFQQQMILKDTILGDKLSDVMSTIYKIIFITFLVELIGMVGIYISTIDYPFEHIGYRIFFAAFHSISAFCNAGFILVEDGMLHPYIETNYSFQMVIALLFIIGGIGFPVVFAFYSQIKNFIQRILHQYFYKKSFRLQGHALGVNSKLMITTTIILTLISIVFISLLEWNNTLASHTFYGKIVGVFFTATTPRSAGFNMIDMTQIAYPTAVFYLLMMWIGSSPGGTGGGIKTTTFSVALMNIWSIAKGEDRVVIYGREISQESLRRSFSIISLSIVLMGFFTFLVYSFDGEFALLHIVFEVFSALNNCGLSLGHTGDYSYESKFILSVAMFVGRVGTLTLLSAFLYKKRKNNYQYPSQDIIH